MVTSRRFGSCWPVAGTLGGIVTVVTLLGVLGSGVLTALFGWGWFWDWLHGGPAAEKFELAV